MRMGGLVIFLFAILYSGAGIPSSRSYREALRTYDGGTHLSLVHRFERHHAALGQHFKDGMVFDAVDIVDQLNGSSACIRDACVLYAPGIIDDARQEAIVVSGNGNLSSSRLD